jgi:DNA-binding NarL/FixJ family response regulator
MSPKRIFIIDDDEAAVFGYSRYLEKSGYVVSAAAYLKDGVGKLDRENFDAVVFDVRLPGRAHARANSPQDLQAAHFRQLDVEQHHLKMARLPFIKDLERLLAVAGDDDFAIVPAPFSI